MGTICGPKPENVREYLMEEYTFENDLLESRAVDCKIVNMRTAYLAVARTFKETGMREVGAVVVLLTYNSGPFGFCEKHISESMGPTESKCPKSILQVLSPTDSEYAKQWRARCWENIDNPRKPFTVKTEFGEAKKYQKLGAAVKYANKLARLAGETVFITVSGKEEDSRYGVSYFGGFPWHISGPKVLAVNGEVIE